VLRGALDNCRRNTVFSGPPAGAAEWKNSDRMKTAESTSMQPALLGLAPAAIIVVGAHGQVNFANAAAARLLGCDPSSLTLDDLASPPARDAVTGYRTALSGSAPPMTMFFSGEFRHVDGRALWIEIQGVNLTSHPQIRGLALSLVDATPHRQEIEALSRLAVTDALTGVGNRTHFMQSLEAALRDLPECVVGSIDVDQFKSVNDRVGHAEGDRVLVAFARRLVGALPDKAVVCRVGGDEFAVVIPGALTPALREAFGQLARVELAPDLGSDEVKFVTASIGLTLGGKRNIHAVTQETDVAVFVAKIRGRQQVVVHDADTARELRAYRGDSEAIDRLAEQNRRLHAEARTDALTGLANRRALAEVEPLIVGNPGSRWATCAVLFIDVDCFGRYNKLYGDRAGDLALQAIASGLQAAARSTDLVYRKGGEEFVVILPHTDFAVAWAVAERMREKIAQLDIVHAEGGPDKRVSVLVSVGVVRPGGAVASAVVASGDEAMRAKEAGRRGSVVGSP